MSTADPTDDDANHDDSDNNDDDADPTDDNDNNDDEKDVRKDPTYKCRTILANNTKKRLEQGSGYSPLLSDHKHC